MHISRYGELYALWVLSCVQTGFPNGCTDGWVNAPLSYDSFGKAMLSSIVCFSLDG